MAELFVYGTLRPGQANHHLIEPFLHKKAKVFDVSKGPFRLVDAGAFPVILPPLENDLGGLIRGSRLFLEPGKENEAFAVLDRLEDEGNLYHRIQEGNYFFYIGDAQWESRYDQNAMKKFLLPSEEIGWKRSDFQTYEWRPR